MKPPTILVVEDNPVSRKMVRVTLEAEGYSVVEAPDATTALALFETAAPDLVLQDLLLPDMDGFELVRRLRALPRGAEAPIVALSGFLSRIEEAQAAATGFSDFLSKPVEPARLLETVQAHLPVQLPAPEDVSEGPRVLAVDDDPIQLKLMRMRLALAGFRVSCASDGQQALETARKEPPDAVLSDLVMPRLDGFRLCLALRSDPRLARVPVVLVSASYLEEADWRLAEDVGANALVPRKADFAEAIEALRAGLLAEPPRPRESQERLETEHVDHIVRRLERQAAVSHRLANRCATQAAALSVLSGIAETLASTQDVRAVLSEVLARCVDAGGLSLGVLYLVGPGGRFRLEAQQGYADSLTSRLEAAFGHPELFREVLAKGVPVAIPSADVSSEVAGDFLKEGAIASAVIVPIVSHHEHLGVLLLASRARALEEGDWIAFARTVAAQVGQAVALTKAVAGLAASESRYRSLFDRNLAGVYRTSLDGAILECNDALARIFGYDSREAMLTQRAPELYLAPEDRAGFLERLKERGPLLGHEFRGRRSDGTAVWLVENASLVRDGDETFIEGTLVDVTERRRLEEQLRQAQKMDAIGQLAGGVAHDFNNILAVITGYSELVLRLLAPEDPQRRRVEEILRAGERAAALTRQLLTFSRKQAIEPRLLDLNALVIGMEGMLRRLIREDIQLVTVFAEAPGRVRGDASQIEQVVLNLAVNARDAMPQGGRLVFETANVELAAEDCRDQIGMSPGPHVLLTVSDTGIGMDAETLSHIFEPFFTTKEAGKGTGLGLATVYGIVRQAGGVVTVRSEPGRGSNFGVYFPRADGQDEAQAPRGPAAAAPRGGEVVLLVEDDLSLREMTREVLESVGYRVLEARHGLEALSVSEAHPGPIHVLVTDVVMPQMNGPDLARRLAAARPETGVLFLSGYTDDAAFRDGLPNAAFLQKPFTPDDLARKVREALESLGSGRRG